MADAKKNMAVFNNDTVEPGVSKLIDSKQPGFSKLFMFPKISFSA